MALLTAGFDRFRKRQSKQEQAPTRRSSKRPLSRLFCFPSTRQQLLFSLCPFFSFFFFMQRGCGRDDARQTETEISQLVLNTTSGLPPLSTLFSSSHSVFTCNFHMQNHVSVLLLLSLISSWIFHLLGPNNGCRERVCPTSGWTLKEMR